MTALTKEQETYLRDEVNKAGGAKYSFLAASPTNGDKKLAVVTVFNNNGELHTATVEIGSNHMWLEMKDQFANVAADVVKKLGRP